MSPSEGEDRRRAERARQVGLFRYGLIQDLIDTKLTTRQRGKLARELAAKEHTDPFGRQVRVARGTLDRWARHYRAGGFPALVPAQRQVTPRTPVEVLDLAAALKKENPARTAAQIQRILRTTQGWSPTDRTLQRHFADAGLTGASGEKSVFGRFEATRGNELWTGDALHGPKIGGRKTYLFAFIDDHSRAIVGHRFGFAEDTVRLAAALRPALSARGVPESIYVDNGSAFVDTWLLRACASLAVRLTHSKPGRPQGRGKIERFFRTVRDQFLVELDEERVGQIEHLAELNRLFTAWVETVYHRTVHSETGQPPIERWLGSIPRPLPLPSPADLREAFLWSEFRTVTKTATVSLHGNSYEVDPMLVGMKVELVFDPFDLTEIEVRTSGKSAGKAVPHRVGRHTHPKARPETPPESAPPTGIDYLKILDETHKANTAKGINYSSLMDDGRGPR
ncbi:DDE-type integrase/transposase/recombinase [Streptomyces sp. NBC_00151]|uniref:DDE-type integrase/transposase/recombinase n=1 Tax=Streptomyces sp. NBC_00151 TaxID=2975669 RepID=UPI002DD9711E|nr:DDE-type integrase/transposase/recombinase [Streptomyces sp. NBC_00151]WRZ44623.1 DDE-type integrase/transposase/recombinase [Streptomyces sp. NBC_00151]